MSESYEILNYTKEEINESIGKVLTPPEPISNNDLATKQYVDDTTVSVVNSRYIELGSEPGGLLAHGTLWYDTNVRELKILTSEGWRVITSNLE